MSGTRSSGPRRSPVVAAERPASRGIRSLSLYRMESTSPVNAVASGHTWPHASKPPRPWSQAQRNCHAVPPLPRAESFMAPNDRPSYAARDLDVAVPRRQGSSSGSPQGAAQEARAAAVPRRPLAAASLTDTMRSYGKAAAARRGGRPDHPGRPLSCASVSWRRRQGARAGY